MGTWSMKGICAAVGSGRPEGDEYLLQRVHAEGFLPAKLVGVGRQHDAVPANPVDELGVEQVDVDGVGIHAVMGDVPDLGPVIKGADQRPHQRTGDDIDRRAGITVRQELGQP